MNTEASPGQRSGLIILGSTLFVTMVGFGLAMPVLPGRVQELGGSGASYGLLVAISAATMLAAGPAWGILSDRIGRKPVLITGLVGLAGSLIGFAAADTMAGLLAARAASGLLSAAVQPAALAYAADTSGEKERGGAIGRLMGFLALGVVLGPGLGGLLGEGSFARPFLVGAGLTAASAVLVLLFVPETRTRRGAARSEPGDRVASAPIRRRLWGMLALVIIATFGTSCFQAVFGLDAVRRFRMTPAWIGLMLVVTGACAALMQGLASGHLSRRLGDTRVARLSFVGGTVGFAALGAAGSAAAELARIGLQVETLYGAPMDIEWARAGGHFRLVQARPVTALPEEEPAPPSTWEPPIPGTKWARASVADFLPDPLTPLFATLGLRVYGESFNALIDEQTGVPDLYGPDYAVTINGYAYVTMNVSAWLLLTLLFRLTPTIIRMMRHARPQWEAERDRYRAAALEAEKRDPPGMSALGLLAAAESVWRAAARHHVIFQTTGAFAGPAEMLLTRLWEKDKKRRHAPGDPSASTLLLGYESEPIRADRSLWDLTERVRASSGLTAWLVRESPRAAAGALASGTKPASVDEEEWAALRAAFQAHLDSHGRTILTLDFVSPTLCEQPETFLMTMKHWLEGRGMDPKARQAASSARREALSASARERAKGLRGWLFRKVLGWAQAAAPLREDSIAAIGLGVPVVRRFLLELGRRSVQAGGLAAAADVFWLEEAELRADASALDARAVLPPRAPEIRRRKALWRSRKRAFPPGTVPHARSFMGFKVADFIPNDANQERGVLKGVAASGGRATAPARVLHGPEDFGGMKAGDVLVAEITTPAWTPLFALASAVVTDVGGPLSHGSIVAREYGIPAVLGTGTATRRLRDGDILAVDGDAGVVRWEEAG